MSILGENKIKTLSYCNEKYSLPYEFIANNDRYFCDKQRRIAYKVKNGEHLDRFNIKILEIYE